MREYVRDRERLEHIIEAIDRILSFADGKTKEELEADSLKYFGVVKNEAVIVEATTSKNLEQTARRMRAKGYSVSDIVEITGLSEDDIESL